MSNSIRIRTTPGGGDKFVKIKLESDFDFIEILSLKISQSDVYKRFCSDYGVVVGRVVMNNGLGIPNAKVSVFIPLSDEDKDDIQISGLYPYEIITDKNLDGIRYNLLPRNSNVNDDCYNPVGTFPSKREVIDNDIILDIYQKYYKFTTTTNDAGDFMIFGIPIGQHTIKVDVDISDIGIYSQRPFDYISTGVPEKMFTSPTKFKSDTDLDKLIQIKSNIIGVNVIPFWGDKDNCDIGITRVDFDLKHNIIPSAIFMGSIFGDNEKNSINKNCRARKDLGRMSETTTNEGTIEMIRKTLDGRVERFDVNGGRLIDANGTWAFQLPMNLDYKITDEFGNLVPSDDPNKGVPTRGRYRFRIGMDISGGEGKRRIRAKYLVPNNPDITNNPDYSFDDSTNDSQFRNLYWNKIYSVKNFIARFQTSRGDDNRHFVGIKDVDQSVGTHTPFPFNRVDTDFNPIFTILCLIINILVLIVAFVNGIAIKILNIAIAAINSILTTICRVIWNVASKICNILDSIIPNFNISKCLEVGCMRTIENSDCPCEKPFIEYVPCITLECNGEIFAPGCDNPDYGFHAAEEDKTSVPQNPKVINHWSGLFNSNPECHPGHIAPNAGLPDCYAIQIAEAMNVFEFDFYNDWVNGTLFAFLLKYKKRRRGKGKEKFCEYDCDDFGGGVDNNNDAESDNNCSSSKLLDTCNNDGEIGDVGKVVIREGLIKKFDDEFYYASATHDKVYKLYATDIINLGAVYECDWQGIPKLQPLLIPTTYNRPPLTSEYETVNSNGIIIDGTTDNRKMVCGMVSLGKDNKGDGLFFDINCLKLSVNPTQCQNIKRQCEFGIDLDEADEVDNTNGDITYPNDADCKLDSNDIDGDFGAFFRSVYWNLNVHGIDLGAISGAIDLEASKFDNVVNGINTLSPEGSKYSIFRNFQLKGDNTYSQPRGSSYYFYFGLVPGNSAVELMNSRFFTKCEKIIQNDFIIDGIVTDASINGGSDGSIGVTIIGGVGPYIYSWVGPNGFLSTDESPINLEAGVYKVTVVDSIGSSATKTFVVNQPTPLFCEVNVINPTTAASVVGIITIDSVTGGIGPYMYEVQPNNTSFSIQPTTYSPNTVIPNVPFGTYSVIITDSASPVGNCTNLVTIEPIAELILSSVTTNTTCGLNNGTLKIGRQNNTGVPPFSYETIGPYNNNSAPPVLPTVIGHTTNYTNIASGTYLTTVVDGIGATGQTISVVNDTPIGITITNLNSPQCWISGQTTWSLNFEINDSSGIYKIAYSGLTTPLVILPATIGDTIIPIQVSKLDKYTVWLVDINNQPIATCKTSVVVDLRPGEGLIPSSFFKAKLVRTSIFSGTMTKFSIEEVSGGWGPPYTYNWDVGNGFEFNDFVIWGTETIKEIQTPVIPKKVKVKVRDNHGFTCNYTYEGYTCNGFNGC